jgi:hypothetical protein
MGSVIERTVFLQYLLLTLVFGGMLIWGRWRNQPERIREAWFHLGTLVSMFVTVYLAYDTFDMRGFRTLSPHLLTSLIVLALMGRGRLVALCAAISLMAAPVALGTYTDWVEERLLTEERQTILDEHGQNLQSVLTYDPDAPSPWCNTVVYNAFFQIIIPSPVLAVPPGFGVTNLAADRDFDALHQTDAYQLRSRYIIWNGVSGPLPDTPNLLEPGAIHTDNYNFLINQDAPCD